MVLDAWKRDLRRDQTSAVDTLVVFTHKFVLLLSYIVTNSLVVGVVA